MTNPFNSVWTWVVLAFALVILAWTIVGKLASKANIESIPVPLPYEKAP